MPADPYVYPGTDVLRNQLGLRDADALARAESDFTNARLVQLVEAPIPGDFDLAHLQAFHRHLFQDLYEWAGQLRTIPIAKADLFCLPQHIETYASDAFGELAADNQLVRLPRKQFVERAAHHLANVNALHPFREGNGRAQRAFFSQLANEAGWELAWDRLSRERNNEASVKATRGAERDLRAAVSDITDPLGRTETKAATEQEDD